MRRRFPTPISAEGAHEGYESGQTVVRIDASGAMTEVPCATDASGTLAWLSLTESDRGLAALVCERTGETFRVLTWDEGSSSWRDGGAVVGVPDIAGSDVDNLLRCARTATVDGWILTGRMFGTSGDTAVIAPAEDGTWVWTGLGALGMSASEGVVVSSIAMAGGDVLFAGVDNRADGGAGVWSLPDELAAQAGTFARTARVMAASGGTASVIDWRGAPADELAMRRGDTAIWTATADQGFTFAGWYSNIARSLVSTDAVYRAALSDDTALEARFVPADAGDDADGSDIGGDASGQGDLPATGDAALASAGSLLALGALAVVAGIRLKRGANG